MIDITRALKALSGKRLIFHSEADFQHALAWGIHLQYPECLMRLEFKPPHLDNRIYVDIWATDKDGVAAIELEYKTRGLYARMGEETFDLLDQSAQDIARYDFLQDVQRLEQNVSGPNNIVGYAVFLTNDSAYWSPPRDIRTVDASFRIHQDRTLNGTLTWGSGASKGTMHNREKPILINGVYKMKWQDYSEPSEESYGKFRYLLVKVGTSLKKS